MATYDVHTHIGIDSSFYLRGWWPYAGTAVDLLAQMDMSGIDRAVCFPYCLSSACDPYKYIDENKVELLPGRVPYDKENALLVNECKQLGDDRLFVLAMFDPSREVDAQLKNLQPLAGQIAGLKLQATIIQSFVADLLDGGKELMAFAEQHDLPVLIHTSYALNDPWSQSKDCLRVAAAYPNVRFNLAHSFRFMTEDLEAAAALPNVWSDCSAHLAHCGGAIHDRAYVAPAGKRPDVDYADPVAVLQACYDILGDSYLWGSDNPFQSWCDDGIKEVHSYKDEVDVIRAMPEAAQQSMLTDAPEAWLFGTRPRK